MQLSPLMTIGTVRTPFITPTGGRQSSQVQIGTGGAHWQVCALIRNVPIKEVIDTRIVVTRTRRVVLRLDRNAKTFMLHQDIRERIT